MTIAGEVRCSWPETLTKRVDPVAAGLLVPVVVLAVVTSGHGGADIEVEFLLRVAGLAGIAYVSRQRALTVAGAEIHAVWADRPVLITSWPGHVMPAAARRSA